MKIIPLTQGLSAIVDDSDFELLSRHKWYANKKRNTWYACRNKKGGGSILMHREILKFPNSFVDHKDRNGLNNSRSNLRLCTKSENMQNRRMQRNNTTGQRGTYFDAKRGKYRAEIQCQGKKHRLGWFDTLEAAATAYKNASVLLHGEFSS